MDTKDTEEIKARLARLEEEVFGMDYKTAERVLDRYLEATKEKPYILPSPSVRRAEKVLGNRACL